MKQNSEVPDPKAVATQLATTMRGIIESGKEAIPICYAMRWNGHGVIIGTPFSGSKEKDQAATMMQVVARNPETAYVIFLSDSWMAKMKEKEYEDYDPSQSLKDRPGRQEGIAITIFGSGQPTVMGQWIYQRVAGRVVFPETITWVTENASNELKGRFAPSHGKVSTQNESRNPAPATTITETGRERT